MKKHRPLPSLLVCTMLLVITTMVPSLRAADLQTISFGEQVELRAHLVSGKLTLFDFYADWCAGCIQLDPLIKRYATAYPDHLAVRKIDIESWGSPVAEQFRLRAIPYLRLYGADGQLMVQGDGNAVLTVLDRQLVKVAGARPEILGDSGARSGSGTASFLVLSVALIVAVVLVLGSFRRRPAQAPRHQTAPYDTTPTPRRDSEQGWFVILQGSLEGPFTPEQLRDMQSRSVLPADAQVRRLNDTTWRTIDQVEG